MMSVLIAMSDGGVCGHDDDSWIPEGENWKNPDGDCVFQTCIL